MPISGKQLPWAKDKWTLCHTPRDVKVRACAPMGEEAEAPAHMHVYQYAWTLVEIIWKQACHRPRHVFHWAPQLTPASTVWQGWRSEKIIFLLQGPEPALDRILNLEDIRQGRKSTLFLLCLCIHFFICYSLIYSFIYLFTCLSGVWYKMLGVGTMLSVHLKHSFPS